jgi:predicted glycosyltransferase involved in capsule biosynthesis
MTNNKQQTAVEWLSNQFYELLEQYSEGNFDRSTFNELMADVTNQAKLHHIADTNEMISDKVLFEQATVAMEEHYGYGCETEIDAYFRGAKWMQKQFKNKNL